MKSKKLKKSDERASAAREEIESFSKVVRWFRLSATGAGALLLVACVFLIRPASAHVSPTINRAPVCACCADEGEWYERTERVQTEQLAQLERVRFSPSAKRYLSPADESDLSEDYSLSHTRAGRAWQLKFRDEQGRTAIISFMIPGTAVSFGADMHDQPPGGLGPTLYKEWRFSGAARITGIFKKGLSGPARFRLILQGSGNRCEGAEDYKHWTLQISGARASYTFYGSLNDPTP